MACRCQPVAAPLLRGRKRRSMPRRRRGRNPSMSGLSTRSRYCLASCSIFGPPGKVCLGFEQFIQHVANADVKCFAEHTIATVQASDDLRVSTETYSKTGSSHPHWWRPISCDDAMVHANERDIHARGKPRATAAPTRRHGPRPGPWEYATAPMSSVVNPC